MITPKIKNDARSRKRVAEQWQACALPPMRKGRPTCPCGFTGGARNISEHRNYCPAWQEWVRAKISKNEQYN